MGKSKITDITEFPEFFEEKRKEDELSQTRTALFTMWYENESKNLYDPKTWKKTLETNPLMKELHDFAQNDFISQVLLRKMTYLGLTNHIIFPYEFLAIIGSCTHDSPGYAQIMLYKILHEAVYNQEMIQLPYIIKTTDFAKVYPDRFPDTEKEPDAFLYSKMWDDQKDHAGRNMCDTIDWWYPEEKIRYQTGILKDGD